MSFLVSPVTAPALAGVIIFLVAPRRYCFDWWTAALLLEAGSCMAWGGWHVLLAWPVLTAAALAFYVSCRRDFGNWRSGQDGDDDGDDGDWDDDGGDTPGGPEDHSQAIPRGTHKTYRLAAAWS